ncbi:hypothetical protein [uncultured Gammaproteobacteria bacterium]|nr:hypothetical protein [uncultured Gammaproteobacteria bacterium]
MIDIFLTAQINLPPGTLFLLGVSYAIDLCQDDWQGLFFK